jgi:hypothetical protein
MNLQELQNKLMELFDGDYANENKVNINNFFLYTQEIEKQEPIENIIDILDNSKNKGNIYIDYDKSVDRIYFSQFSTNDYLGIDIKFIMPFSKLSSQKNPFLVIQTDNFEDEEDFLDSDWPNNYILFDEKIFNQFMYPHKTPEFMNWKSSPWGVKQ